MVIVQVTWLVYLKYTSENKTQFEDVQCSMAF